jgi:hypothetical protein
MIALIPANKEIIAYIIAKNENERLPFLRIYPYLRAFSGDFVPDMPFTFYFAAEERPMLFNRETKRPAEQSNRAVFALDMAKRKPELLEITQFYGYLSGNGYVRRVYKGIENRQALPKGYERYWRRYQDFDKELAQGLAFVCLADFFPKIKLYDLWESIKLTG